VSDENDELEPLPPDLAALMADERARPQPGPSEREAAWARLAPIVGGAGGAGGPGGAASGAAASGAAASGTAPGGTGLGARIGLAGGGLVVGVALGAALHAWLAPAGVEVRTETRIVETRVEVPVPSAPAAPVDLAAPIDAPLPVEPPLPIESTAHASESPVARVRPATDSDAGASRDRSLAQENALITRAQSALARRQPTSAIEALREHAAQYPRGQLVEEREALWVQALALADDHEAAAQRAARFRARFPGSLLMPAVEAAVQGVR
jgi:hypothetical protein